MLRKELMKAAKVMFAGMTMALCVTAFNPTVQVNADMLTESEPNNTPAQANELSLNSWMKGVSTKSGDADWYQFTIPQNGYSQLELQKGDDNPKNSAKWNVRLEDANRHMLITNKTYKLGLAPGKYYIKVSPVSGAGVNDTYNLRVNFTESDQWEAEQYYGNKNLKNANPAVVNKTYTGNLYTTSDKDWYRFKLDGTNGAIFKFAVDEEVSAPGKWRVQFIEAATGKILKSTRLAESGDVNKNYGKTSQTVSAAEAFKVSKCNGDIVVKISNVTSTTGKIYHVQLSSAVYNTDITSGSSSKNQVKIGWNAVNSATGYYVYRSTSAARNYTKIATVTGTKYTDKKGLTKNKTYYYRVVAFQNTESGIVTAEPSAYKSVRVKK